jgi:amidase/aspartyl-tRNA(Asn)/glutamyl-tRNA(Gln) amidotransferase subunit A
LTGWHFAVVEPLFLDGLDAEVARAFADSLSALSRAGARITHPPLAPLADLPALQHEGGLPAAESWAWHRELIARRGHQYDPRVATRIRRGATATPASVSALEHLRADWITRMGQALGGVDVVLSPTVPMVAPPIAPMLADDALFFDTNARLLRNPSVVNLLDGCAISLPCQRLGSAPVGLMLWAAGEQDERLLGAALAVEAALESGRHA